MSRPNSKYSRAVLVPSVSFDWPCVSPQKCTSGVAASTARSGFERASSLPASSSTRTTQSPGRLHAQAIRHRCEAARREAQRVRQPGDRRALARKPQRAIDEIGGIAPLVVSLDRKPERLACAHQRRQHRAPAHARPRQNCDLRALRQRHVVVGGDRVGEHAELELALAIGLQPNAGRALPAVAEADGDGVAGGQEILHHAHIERPAPGADVALELPLGLQGGPVGGLDRRVALSPMGSVNCTGPKSVAKRKPILIDPVSSTPNRPAV